MKVKINFNGTRIDDNDEEQYVDKTWVFNVGSDTVKDIVDMVRTLTCVHPEGQCGDEYATIEVDDVPAHEHRLTRLH